MKLINADNLIVISVEDNLAENIDEIIEKLHSETIILKPLLSTVLPNYETQEKKYSSSRQLNKTATDTKPVLSIVLYGFDKYNKTVDAKTLTE